MIVSTIIIATHSTHFTLFHILVPAGANPKGYYSYG